jgi:hypothetical protein
MLRAQASLARAVAVDNEVLAKLPLEIASGYLAENLGHNLSHL